MKPIIIRGPAGVGKSTISRIVAAKLSALHISFDDILRNNKLDKIEGDGISAKNFILGNELALDIVKQTKPRFIVFDGCFYRDEQIKHLTNSIKAKFFIFTLKATLQECLMRNNERGKPMPDKAVEEVYSLVNKKDYGVIIGTSGKTALEVSEEILSHLDQKKAK